MYSLPFSLGILLLAMAGEVPPAPALPPYTITDLGSLAELDGPAEDAGGMPTTAIARHINAKGQVVGWLTAGGRPRAFLWEDGRRTFLNPADVRSTAVGINDRGQVLVFHLGPPTKEKPFGRKHEAFLMEGGRETALDLDSAHRLNNRGQVLGLKIIEGEIHLVVWEAGRLTDLSRRGVPGPIRSFGYYFNDRGQVTGTADWAGIGDKVEWKGFLWEDGRVTELGPRTTPGAINNRGQVAGLDVAASPSRPVVWEGGARRELGMLDGFRLPMAHAIDDRGVVVGSASRTTIGESRAMLWKDGIPADLNAEIPAGLNWILQGAWDINDRGEIVGSGTLDGSPHAFLLKPR